MKNQFHFSLLLIFLFGLSLWEVGCLSGKSEKAVEAPTLQTEETSNPPSVAELDLSLEKSTYASNEPILIEMKIGVGKFDLLVQRFCDAWNAFPGLILLLTIMSIVGRGVVQIILVMGISGGIGGSRVLRGAVIGIKENDYFLAARAIGSPTTATLMRHVLPNIMPVVIVIFSITIGGVIIAEASLSFLGFGLPPEVPSWGSMLSREGRQYMEIAPRLAIWPGVCLTTVVFSLNMFGDAMRDLLDPRLRGGEG